MSYSWVSSRVTHEIQNSSWGFSWGIFVPHRFPHEDFSSLWVSSWGITFHEEIGSLPHEVLMRKPIFHEDLMRLFSTRNLIPHEYLMRFTMSNFFFTRKLAHFFLSCSWGMMRSSWGFFHKELWFLVRMRFCMRNIFDGDRKWPSHFLMRTSRWHEVLMRLFPWGNWVSINRHPNMSFLARNSMRISFHEEICPLFHELLMSKSVFREENPNHAVLTQNSKVFR